MPESNALAITKDKFYSILKGALIAAGSAGITYLLNVVIPWLQTQPGVNMTIVTIAGILLNAAKKWFEDTSVEVAAKEQEKRYTHLRNGVLTILIACFALSSTSVLALEPSNAFKAGPRSISFSEVGEVQSITITGPTVQLAPRDITKLSVDGITDEELANTSVEVSPSEGVYLEPGMGWNKKPYITFSAVKPGKYTVTVSFNKTHADWRTKLDAGLTAAKLAKVDETLIVELQAIVTKAETTYPTKTGVCVLEVTGPQPPPPPTPVPDGDSPFPAAGLRVLILEETANRQALPESQLQILNSTTIRSYLASKCARTPDGKRADWRQWDDDFTAVNLANETQMWRDVYAKSVAKANGNLPWIVIGNGTSGTSQPLPQTEAATLELLKKYGG